MQQLFIKAHIRVVMTAMAYCCVGSAASAADIPDSLKVPPGQILAQQLRASGVQIYRCQATKQAASRFEWQFTEPQAKLFDQAGKEIGTHFAGPTWQALDGSKVVGEVVARASPAPDAVAWLLLSVKEAAGSGLFSGVKSIQRLHTVGGNAPDGCDAAQSGREVRVPYTADYWFYIAKP